MTPDQTIALSNFLNGQANLPADIQVIADTLKESLISSPKRSSKK